MLESRYFMYLTKKKVKNDLKNNDIVIYISDRAGRKTSVVQDCLIEEWQKNDYKPIFALLRTKTDENITESWFSDFIITKYNKFKFYHKKINNYITTICAKVGEEEKTLCFNFFVSVSQKYKSSFYNGFETIKYIIWEECIPEKHITQNIDVIKNSEDVLNSVFSIGSTVCRLNKPKFIFIGNDIEYNFLNPVTVKFNLLDKIELDKDISDTIQIYNGIYKFNFLYFSFKDSVNHWQGLQDISLIKNVDNLGEKTNFILLLNNTKYYIYENEFVFNIVDFENIEEFNEKKMLKKFFNDEVISQYFSLNLIQKQVFLEILRIKSSDFNSVFKLYYGVKLNPEKPNNLIYFYDDKTKKAEEKTYNIDTILNDYNYIEIILNCTELYELFKKKMLKKRIYSNFAIKTKMERLIELLIISFAQFN